jgi:hypothetical protein
MSEMPNDPIAEFQSVLFKDLIIKYIKRKNLTFINVIANLPTKISFVG